MTWAWAGLTKNATSETTTLAATIVLVLSNIVFLQSDAAAQLADDERCFLSPASPFSLGANTAVLQAAENLRQHIVGFACLTN